MGFVNELSVLDVAVPVFVHFCDYFLQVVFQDGFDLHVLLESVDYYTYREFAIALLVLELENIQEFTGGFVDRDFVIDIRLEGKLQLSLTVEKH